MDLLSRTGLALDFRFAVSLQKQNSRRQSWSSWRQPCSSQARCIQSERPRPGTEFAGLTPVMRPNPGPRASPGRCKGGGSSAFQGCARQCSPAVQRWNRSWFQFPSGRRTSPRVASLWPAWAAAPAVSRSHQLFSILPRSPAPRRASREKLAGIV